jgi:hypothetical protein
LDDVVSQTGFPLDISSVTESRAPTDEELKLIREIFDPSGLRDTEIKS